MGEGKELHTPPPRCVCVYSQVSVLRTETRQRSAATFCHLQIVVEYVSLSPFKKQRRVVLSEFSIVTCSANHEANIFKLICWAPCEPLPGESLPHGSRTCAKGGTMPTTFAHLRCGMGTKICARRRRKVCRISRLRVPQAGVAEAR